LLVVAKLIIILSFTIRIVIPYVITIIIIDYHNHQYCYNVIITKIISSLSLMLFHYRTLNNIKYFRVNSETWQMLVRIYSETKMKQEVPDF